MYLLFHQYELLLNVNCMWPWTTKPILSRWCIFVEIAKKCIVWVKILDFSFMPKIIRTLIKIMFHEDIFLISYSKYIKTLDNFKGYFSQYLDFYFVPPDSRLSDCILAKYYPILTNHTSMESVFIQLSVFIWALWLVLWSRVTYGKNATRRFSEKKLLLILCSIDK